MKAFSGSDRSRADSARRNLYPVDFDALIERHALLGMTRDQLLAALPALRGMGPEPLFAGRDAGDRATSQRDPRAPAQRMPAPR